jgi:hypothetical protein
VGHEDDSLGAILEGALDGRDGAGDALGVGDVFVLVEGNVEVDLRVLANESCRTNALPIKKKKTMRREQRAEEIETRDE